MGARAIEAANKAVKVESVEVKRTRTGRLRGRTIIQLDRAESTLEQKSVKFTNLKATVTEATPPRRGSIGPRSLSLIQRGLSDRQLVVSCAISPKKDSAKMDELVQFQKSQRANLSFLKVLVEEMQEDQYAEKHGIFRVPAARGRMGPYKTQLAQGKCPKFSGEESAYLRADLIKHCLRSMSPRLLEGLNLDLLGLEHLELDKFQPSSLSSRKLAEIRKNVDRFFESQEAYRRALFLDLLKMVDVCIKKQEGLPQPIDVIFIGRMLSTNLFPEPRDDSRIDKRDICNYKRRLPGYFAAMYQAYRENGIQ